MFPLVMKIVPESVGFNPILAKIETCHRLCHDKIEQRGRQAPYQYPPPDGGEFCVVPLPEPPEVVQEATAKPVRARKAAEKKILTHMMVVPFERDATKPRHGVNRPGRPFIRPRLSK
ncbi:hypothetical protein [Rhizobium sp. SYY.PMSO]|uniref:hypothetical protein n=1 Tax=Rhizobium sp. SYY.PMSO TaxID=3382192 RepID=UPI00398F8EA9